MSRGVKDLRALISVSRLGSVPEDCCLYRESSKEGQNSILYDTLDETSLKDILERSNKDLNWICEWSQDNNMKVNFMNWWLTGLPDGDRRDLFNLEYEIVCAEMVLIMKIRCKDEDEAEKVSRHFLSVVFWEYPNKIFSDTGPHLFLDYLDSLVSQDCKHLLSAVSVTSRDEHTIRNCLSLRAFAIVSLWSALIRFHSNLISTAALSLSPLHSHLSHTDESLVSLLSIVLSHDFTEVLNYWVKKKIDIETFRDSEGRNIVTLAVSFKSVASVKFLLNECDVRGIINTLSNAGNCALHLAVCQGSLELTKLLVLNGHADVGVLNPNCDDCSALHMAATYGQEDIAKFLIEQGADPSVKTRLSVSAADMAEVFKESQVLNLITSMRLVANDADYCLS